MFIVARPLRYGKSGEQSDRARPGEDLDRSGYDGRSGALGAMTRLTRTPPSLETVASRIFLSASASFASASFTAASSSAALGEADAVCSVRSALREQILEFRDPPLSVSKLPEAQ